MDLFFKYKRGQALVEGLILILPLILVFFLIFQLIISKWSHLLVSQYIYQSLICVSQGESRKKCTISFKDKIQNLVPWAHIQKARISGSINQWRMQVIWEDFFIKNRRIHINRSLKIPEDLL